MFYRPQAIQITADNLQKASRSRGISRDSVFTQFDGLMENLRSFHTNCRIRLIEVVGQQSLRLTKASVFNDQFFTV